MRIFKALEEMTQRTKAAEGEESPLVGTFAQDQTTQGCEKRYQGSYIPIPILSIVLSRGVPESSFKSSWSVSSASAASSSMTWSERGDVGLSIVYDASNITKIFGLVDGFGK